MTALEPQFGYYVAGQEPPIIHKADELYICWSPAVGFKVFDNTNDRLVETFEIGGLSLDEAEAIAKAYTEDFYD